MSAQPVAVVTGGASGIGAGIGSALRDTGFDVFVLDSNLELVAQYNDTHPLSRARPCDVSDALSVLAEVKAVTDFSKDGIR